MEVFFVCVYLFVRCSPISFLATNTRTHTRARAQERRSFVIDLLAAKTSLLFVQSSSFFMMMIYIYIYMCVDTSDLSVMNMKRLMSDSHVNDSVIYKKCTSTTFFLFIFSWLLLSNCWEMEQGIFQFDRLLLINAELYENIVWMPEKLLAGGCRCCQNIVSQHMFLSMFSALSTSSSCMYEFQAIALLIVLFHLFL